MSIFVDIHVLQTVPPSCINRDDTGSPKTAVYGGVIRARVSSQAWKHAMRQDFLNMLPMEMIGNRTKRIVPMVMREIEKTASEQGKTVDDPEKLARSVLSAAGLKLKEDINTGTDALFFMSAGQAKALAELAVNDPEHAGNKKLALEALRGNPSIDMALFGRMVADDQSLNYDAAAQVAHAISTHAVHTEYDYFTAVDDLSKDESTGAGHIGTNEFASSTLYRYATLNVSELAKHVENDVAAATTAFVKAFIHSMPTGKQNTFANRTLPDMVYVTVRKDQPVNLCGAFERAVRSDGDGFAEMSVIKLRKYAEQVYKDYASAPDMAFVIGTEMLDAKRVTEPEMMKALVKLIEGFDMTGGGK
ncbi:MAG: type I-E CRISPR-associated protein Cas7/Cse4/CasC [Clostridia bacterium]|nr:type I-E CRISPR-associated protein Cas7/Cse4/CasC [Clostridia bacterium]